MPRIVDVATSWTASVFRVGLGLAAGHAGARPKKPVHLYEFEACPYCRKVREALTALDLQAVIYPCPKNGPRFRPDVVQRGGKPQFPYMIDPNTGDAMYESRDIIEHLYAHYGNRPAPWWLKSDLTVGLGSLASAIRGGRGHRYRDAQRPKEPLELYSYEGSPYSRLAREVLCELELPYVLHSVGRGSASRADFRERSGRMMVPWLHDPNTGESMFESADIVAYLRRTYAG